VNDLPQAKPSDPARAQLMATYGDRLFRSGNVHRAGERYEQALRADSSSTAALVGLAQVAISRGEYAEAANRFRQVLEVRPNWLANAPDVQALYGEPSDFAKAIARIESHLQANPNDRDAWFVLGAEWFLSGRTRRAADVFLRLTDRKVDPALEAFLEASTPAPK
jgi:cytochrome c-type biogenesis protein CcmH/NrfG